VTRHLREGGGRGKRTYWLGSKDLEQLVLRDTVLGDETFEAVMKAEKMVNARSPLFSLSSLPRIFPLDTLPQPTEEQEAN
jgi:hypothetical protein